MPTFNAPARRTVLKAGAAAAIGPYVLSARAAVQLRLTHPAAAG